MEDLLRIADEDAKLHKLAQDYFGQGNHTKALEVIEDSISIRGRDDVPGTLLYLQGSILFELGGRTQSIDLKLPYLLGCVECFSEDSEVHAFAAVSLLDLAQRLGSAVYYKKALSYAKESLSLLASFDESNMIEQDTQSTLQNIVEVAESKIRLGLTGDNSGPKVTESKEIRDARRSDTQNAVAKRYRAYWAGRNVEEKRNFMKLSTAELGSYIEMLYGGEGRDALDQVIDSARINKRWKFWMCRSCSQRFFNHKNFKNHLEQDHAAKFKPSSTRHMAKRVNEVWAGMLSVGSWEPLDAEAAAEMINNRPEDVKGFVYENGWSRDWPVAVDEERRKLLMVIHLLLVSLWKYKVLSCSLKDWMMQFLVEHFSQFEVAEHTLTIECRLMETPQSICFLGRHELNQIKDLLKRIKYERNDGTDLVRNATEILWGGVRVRERIDFDPQFTFMLLDKRLLKSKIASFDDEGIIEVCDHNVHYAKTNPQGDDIITWLLDYPLLAESFEFPRSIRAYNLDICVAVLRTIQFTCRNLGTKYAKKLEILGYDAALTDAKNLCILEDERRMDISEDQWKTYASLLCDRCKENLATDDRNSHSFLCAVRDVLHEESDPTFDSLDLEDCLKLIVGHKNLSDDIVLKSIDHLKSVVTNKVPVVDSKILLVENSRINLLDDLIRLSNFDYRSHILHMLKRFLREGLDGILDMESKAKGAAAEAELLSEEKQEKEKKSGAKKTKPKSQKRTSTSLSSNPPDQNVEHEPPVDLEPGVTSPSHKTPEEDSMEPEDTLSGERGPLEIPSNTENQEEVAKDMQTMPGVDLQLEHLEPALGEAAARYNSALHMTVKALLNITVLIKDLRQSGQNLQEQVPCALRNFFNAFVSDEIKEDGVYSFLLSDLLASLEEVHPMSRVAAEVVVDVLEFWHYWKSPKKESLVTRLFTLEEYERMSCRKCRKEPNYPEQTSYGIAMAADSIRDLKCAFGNMKFVDILKQIRLEERMLCDMKTGGCGETNFVRHVISSCPPIFTIVLEWKKNETKKEISETTKALEWEIDMSRLYEGLEPNTKYRLVSMVGCGEDEEHICLAYKKNRWVSFRSEASTKAVVGNWKAVVRFCGEKKVRPEILFFQEVSSVKGDIPSLNGDRISYAEVVSPGCTIPTKRPSYAELAARLSSPSTTPQGNHKPSPSTTVSSFSRQPRSISTLPEGHPVVNSKIFVNQPGVNYLFKPTSDLTRLDHKGKPIFPYPGHRATQ